MGLRLETLARSRLLQIVAYILVWTALGMIAVTQTLMSYAAAGDQPPIGLIARLALPTWYSWAVIVPLIFLAGRRFPLDEGRWTRHLPLHVAFNAAVLMGVVLMVFAARRAFGFPPGPSLTIQLVGSLNTGLLGYWTIVLVAHGVGYYRDRRSEQMKGAALSAQLSRARLAVLQAQLHPHFLFNTMNAISAFVRPEPEKAETMIAELAELLRLSLDGSDDQVVPLERELEFVRRYLSIQKTRLGDRFAWELDVDPSATGVRVPSFVLQPLVENAVEHGIAKRRDGGRLWIRIRGDHRVVRVDVSNDGPQVSPDGLAPAYWGVGLSNTSDRLTQMYGEAGLLELTPRDGGGAIAHLVIPMDSDPPAHE